MTESLVQELAELRLRLARKHRQIVNRIRRRTPWLSRTETIPKDVAIDCVAESAWWLTHSSGTPVRAPGHADRLYMLDRHGWALDFGANTLLVGKAIARCRDVLNELFEEASKGRLLTLREVRQALQREVSGAVANYNGDEYGGYYPVSDGRLVFGAQAIDVDEFVGAVLRMTDASVLFVSGR